jgi:hypothetical protein
MKHMKCVARKPVYAINRPDLVGGVKLLLSSWNTKWVRGVNFPHTGDLIPGGHDIEDV